MTDQSVQAIKIFFCYAHEDEALREQLARHLSPLQRLRQITGWFDRDIQAGTDWEREIETHLDTANIILLLVSADFIASDYCYTVEMGRALEKHKAETARVIPIILRPVDWEETPIGKLDALPTGKRAVTQWPNQDEAWLNVVQGIRKVVRSLLPTVLLSQEEISILYPEQGYQQIQYPSRSQPQIPLHPLPQTSRPAVHLSDQCKRLKDLHSPSSVVVLILMTLLLLSGGSIGIYGTATGNWPWHSSPGALTATVPGKTAQVNVTATTPATAVTTPYPTVDPSIIAANPNPYPPGGGTLALYDPLRDSSSVYRWDYDATYCVFKQDGYHMMPMEQNSLSACSAGFTNFSNFAYEVQMQILKGDGGGLTFRIVRTLRRNYLFFISQVGSYGLYLYSGNTNFTTTILAHGSSPAIKQGLNQVNRLAVVALGSTITLYINYQQIASVNDSTYSQGQIGLVAGTFNTTYASQTEVVFSTAKVWTF